MKVWDVEAGKEAISIDGKHDDVVTGLSWNWNGNLLATISKDKKIRILDVRANQVVQVIHITNLCNPFSKEKLTKELSQVK